MRQVTPDGADDQIATAELTPELLAEQIAALRVARARHLAERPVSEIVAAIDAAARRLLDPVDPLRQEAEALLPAATGYSPQMVAHVLDRMAADWLAPRLEELLRAELGEPAALDGFVLSPNRGRSRAFGPVLTFHVFSGNVPGVAVTSLIRALLVKSASIGKTAAGEPVLPVIFARALAAVDAGLGECLAVAYWPGGTENLEEVALRAADAVIVYGDDDTVSELRRRAPDGARFLGYGHRLSFAAVGREAVSKDRAEATAAAMAMAAATFDQHGCVSPHVAYVERGGDLAPEAWAELLGSQLAAVEARLPRGTVSRGEHTAIQQLRGAAEFYQISGKGTRLFASELTEWTVVYEPDPEFQASCLNRVVRVKPVDDLMQVAELSRPVAHLLQTVAIEADPRRRERLAATLGRLGASRITTLEHMPWPPPAWHHDGRPPLADLVKWADLEG